MLFIAYHHRDIKPANVMIDDSGEAVLMDLGSANKARVEIKTRSEAQAVQVSSSDLLTFVFTNFKSFHFSDFTFFFFFVL